MISPAEKFQLEAECGEWKLRAEKAERERDEAREQRNQAQMTWDDEHDAKLKAERERDEALHGEREAQLLAMEHYRKAEAAYARGLDAGAVALASSQAREQELRMALLKLRDEVDREFDTRTHLNLNTADEWERQLWAICDALARPSDTSELREFGLKVARAMYVCPGQEPLQKRDEAIVDAVLGAPTSLERK